MKLHVAVPTDLLRVTDIMYKCAKEATPELRTCRKSCKHFVQRAISSRTSLVLFSDKGHLIIADEAPMLWAEKRFTQVLICAGGGEVKQLLQDVIAWWEGRKASQFLCYTTMNDTGECAVFESMHFKPRGTMLVRMRYGTVE